MTIVYQGPGTGREFRLRHENKRGDRVQVAWVGQEFPVRFPRRRPERFHLMLDSEGRTSGVGGPNCMVILLGCLGTVVQSFFGVGLAVGADLRRWPAAPRRRAEPGR